MTTKEMRRRRGWEWRTCFFLSLWPALEDSLPLTNMSSLPRVKLPLLVIVQTEFVYFYREGNFCWAGETYVSISGLSQANVIFPFASLMLRTTFKAYGLSEIK